MKYEVFNETHNGTRRALVLGPETMHIAYPACMRGIMQFVKGEGLGISLFRAGFDGIELATDPHRLTVPYLEYGVYSDRKKYLSRKAAYLHELAAKAVTSQATSVPSATEYRLTNGQIVRFYADDAAMVLVWRAKREDMYLPLSDAEFQGLIDGTFEGETIYDPQTDLPLLRSRGLAERPEPSVGAHGKLRFDGVYALPQKHYTKYLRFFPTGQVVGVNSSGSAAQVIRWLDTEFECSGAYTVHDDTVAFEIQQEDLEIGSIFWGEVRPDSLLLNWKDRRTSRKINTGCYVFEPISASDTYGCKQ